MLYEAWMTRQNAATVQAYARLTDQEKQDLQGKLIEMHNEVHATVLVMCDSGWANQAYDHWGLTIFPDMDSRVYLHHQMQQSGFYHFLEADTMVGTSDQETRLPTYERPIYVLSRLRNDPVANMARRGLSQAEMQQLWTDYMASYDKNGGCRIIECNQYWSNDAYLGFDLNAFPGLQELQDFKADIMQLDWPLYYPTESILGLPSTM